MTLEKLFETLEDATYCEYIVRLKYKYDWETEYTYSNELILDNGRGDWYWQNDWDEGQTDVEVVGFMAVDDVAVPPISKSRTKHEIDKLDVAVVLHRLLRLQF